MSSSSSFAFIAFLNTSTNSDSCCLMFAMNWVWSTNVSALICFSLHLTRWSHAAFTYMPSRTSSVKSSTSSLCRQRKAQGTWGRAEGCGFCCMGLGRVVGLCLACFRGGSCPFDLRVRFGPIDTSLARSQMQTDQYYMLIKEERFFIKVIIKSICSSPSPHNPSQIFDDSTEPISLCRRVTCQILSTHYTTFTVPHIQ